jgi:hypothetical protein
MRTFLFFILLGLSLQLHAADVRLEAKAAYFAPTNQTFRQIYGGGGLYNLEFSAQTWGGLYAWGSAGFFRQSGYSIGGHDRTSITFVPLGIGLKYLFTCKNTRPYLGIGIQPTYLHIRDDSPYVIPSSNKWGVSGIIKSGLMIDLTDRLFFDLFVDYSFIKVPFSNQGPILRNAADLSGFSFGGGLGRRF